MLRLFPIAHQIKGTSKNALLSVIVTIFALASDTSFAACQYAELINFIKTGNSEGVASYLSKDCSANAPSPTSISALELSLILNKTDIFRQLVKADENLVKTHGVNALAAACNINVKNKVAIEMLAAKGVDINTMSANGFSCLYNAAVVPDIDFFNYLLSIGANPRAKVVPDPIYEIDHLISVEDFIKRRTEDYQTLNRITTEATLSK